jgi:hypothetical protein
VTSVESEGWTNAVWATNWDGVSSMGKNYQGVASLAIANDLPPFFC